ncbi:hypothetical protein [Brevibacterium sp. XM4083]|uniref:hypothetical protein n=1 Tax=Brevibacterium sp. XM4083 TaxID=2583238 RepID=UPI00112CAAF2|nr:hypothetical protein [Brevibacterium sp. XM4083]MCM1011905.1 hypothetical protein [Brevibacterium sp. XM4083]
MKRVTTPVKGYTGIVAGVAFTDGEGHTDDAAALAYFSRHGYRVADEEETPASDDESTGNGDDSTGAGESTAGGTPAGDSGPDPEDDPDTVGDEDSDEEHPGAAVKPGGNGSAQAWRDYALATGHTEDELEGLNRNEIRELVEN